MTEYGTILVFTHLMPKSVVRQQELCQHDCTRENDRYLYICTMTVNTRVDDLSIHLRKIKDFAFHS